MSLNPFGTPFCLCSAISLCPAALAKLAFPHKSNKNATGGLVQGCNGTNLPTSIQKTKKRKRGKPLLPARALVDPQIMFCTDCPEVR